MLRNQNIAPKGCYSAAAKAARAAKPHPCAVPDCDANAVTRACLSINNAPPQMLPVCQQHADAAAEDKP